MYQLDENRTADDQRLHQLVHARNLNDLQFFLASPRSFSSPKKHIQHAIQTGFQEAAVVLAEYFETCETSA